MKRLSSALAWMLPLAAGLAAGCSDDKGTDTSGTPDATDTEPYPREKLLDPETCKECHQEHFREWSGSMHAYASTDPIFRAMNARGQKETNGALGDFCVKCHAPMATSEGVTDGTDLDSVPKQLQGVTCYFCHNVISVTGTHNNPLVIANDQTMRGGIIAPLKYKAHSSEYSKLFDDDVSRAGFESSGLCGGCHDIVVPGHFSGAAQDVPLEQTFAEWTGSVFADTSNGKNKVVLNCTSGGTCHMAREKNVPIANPPLPHPTMPTRVARHLHDFPAVDTALVTDFPEKDDQLKKIKNLLSQEFRIEVCADPPGGTTNAVQVTLENLSAGHNFPSGASQDRRLWVELHVYKKGKELTSSGVVPPGVAATSVAGTWVLYDQAFKADGKTEAHMFWDVASLKSQTIPVSTLTEPNRNQKTHPEFRGAIEPDRITVTLWLEPVGLEVIDDMIDSGFLDKSFRDLMPRYPIEIVGIPPTDSTGRPISFEWTIEDALGDEGYTLNNRYCFQNTAPRFPVTITP
jgi:hypothetical protein